MFQIYLCVTAQHDWRLVLLAACICGAATLSAAYLYAKTPLYPLWRRSVWLGMTGLVAGSGIWTTHFVAMLAFRTGLPERFEIAQTLGSLLVAVGCTTLGFALGALRGEPGRRLAPTAAAGLVVGLGVTLMHYVGMLGYRTAGHILWSGAYVSASVVIGAVLAMAALSVVRPGSGPGRQAAGAGLLTLGIVGMHFTGMTAVTILPDPTVAVPPASLPKTLMALFAVGGAGLIMVTVLAGSVFDLMGRSRDLGRLRAAIDAMPDGLAFFDVDDRLVVWNAAYADLHAGRPLRVGQAYADLLLAEIEKGKLLGAASDRARWASERRAARLTAGAQPPMVFRTADGRWMRVTDRRTADGGLVTVFADVTAEQEADAAMQHAFDLASEASRIKSEFLANMSHEIRTPMNGIVGMNALLLMTSLTPDQRRQAEVVRDSADALLGMINDVLDIAKLEAGQVQADQEPFRLDDLVRGVERDLIPAVQRKGLALSTDIEPAAGRDVLGDPRRLRQAVAHLASNAVKFTDSGEVRIETTLRPAGAGRCRARIAVVDTGIGVPAEVRPRLFQPFQQADSSHTRRHGGAGLGLSIARHTVRLMGGDIGLQDRPGGGSVFWIELELADAPAKARKKAA